MKLEVGISIVWERREKSSEDVIALLLSSSRIWANQKSRDKEGGMRLVLKGKRLLLSRCRRPPECRLCQSRESVRERREVDRVPIRADG